LIGKEIYWPSGYFAHKKQCENATSKALKGYLNIAKERGIPIPKPDVQRFTSFQDYVVSLQNLVRRYN
jgi:hypothetical protein